MSVPTPRVVRDPAELRAVTAEARRVGHRVGFVPTMGALHRGHLRLVEEARARAGLVVVSVFVNPTQFGPNEDFERYPRDLERDPAACASAGADVVYAPSVEAMYPLGHSTTVHVAGLTAGLCGRHRPGHFDGVATVVAKLFGQVGPCVALFGRKDYQQLRVIERMVRDLDFEVEVVGVATVREPDGLAMSSRNAYLAPADRSRALALVSGLSAAWRLVDGRRGAAPPTAEALLLAARARLDRDLDSIDYVEVCDPATLEPLAPDQPVAGPVLVVMAGRLGTTRLIDNLVIPEQPDPLA
jgi:pantoate--beta-alanine ligase